MNNQLTEYVQKLTLSKKNLETYEPHLSTRMAEYEALHRRKLTSPALSFYSDEVSDLDRSLKHAEQVPQEHYVCITGTPLDAKLGGAQMAAKLLRWEETLTELTSDIIRISMIDLLRKDCLSSYIGLHGKEFDPHDLSWSVDEFVWRLVQPNPLRLAMLVFDNPSDAMLFKLAL